LDQENNFNLKYLSQILFLVISINLFSQKSIKDVRGEWLGYDPKSKKPIMLFFKTDSNIQEEFVIDSIYKGLFESDTAIYYGKYTIDFKQVPRLLLIKVDSSNERITTKEKTNRTRWYLLQLVRNNQLEIQIIGGGLIEPEKFDFRKEIPLLILKRKPYD